MPTPLTHQQAQDLDRTFSDRTIELDPQGYFLIYLDRGHICADHYSNTINNVGIACDPETGEPLPCDTKVTRQPTQKFQGRTAKELSIKLFEKNAPLNLRPEHIAYLGREIQRAEHALYQNQPYIQD